MGKLENQRQGKYFRSHKKEDRYLINRQTTNFSIIAIKLRRQNN